MNRESRLRVVYQAMCQTLSLEHWSVGRLVG